MRILFLFTLFNLFLLRAIAGDSSGIVINEILFNPSRDGFDYVEIFNNGKVATDLSRLLIGNRNITNDIASLKRVHADPLLLLPGTYAVITTNAKWLKQEYLVDPAAILCQPASMPSYPDQEGWVVLVNGGDSSIIEEVHYTDDWHFSLIDDVSGVSLERIDPGAPANDPHNWTSASSASGFGTPGSKNSQYHQWVRGGIAVDPPVISPDNDGTADYLTIGITVEGPGFLANCSVFDMDGRMINQPVRNAVLGSSNRFRWDGLDIRRQRVAPGIYIIITQVFNIDGRTRKYKNTCVVK